MFLAFFVLGLNLLIAQTVQITGTVTSKEDGQPLPGASVLVKGTQTGTTTDFNGKYSLNIPSDAQTLVISFVGMKQMEVAVAGRSIIDAELESETVGLEEVVVTAIGIKKSEKSIGYAATSVKSEELVKTQNAAIMSSLAGKVAGLQVSNAGGPGASTKVVVRGYSSFSENQPLYVVDGMPINNNFNGNDEFSRSVDYGNAANDINPDDVESVTILKGASATALYGSRAANGVIMITTKSGKRGDKIQVSYAGSYSVSEALRTPQSQNVFGQGWGLWDPAENGSWGPKIDNIIRPWGTEVNGVYQEKPFSFVKDNLREFFDDGYETNHNLSISGGGEISNFAFSYGYTEQDGIIPTEADKFTRHTVSFRGGTKFKKFELSYNVGYVRKDMNAVAAGQGQSDGGATLYQELIQTPSDIRLTDLVYQNEYNNSDNFYTWYAANPYFVLNENGNKMQDDRFYGKVELSYEIINGLKAIGRIGGDFSNARIKEWAAIEKFSADSWSAVGEKQETVGKYRENAEKNQQLDLNFLLDANYKVGTNWQLKGVAGLNFNQIDNSFVDSYVTGLNVDKWYSLDNSSERPISESYMSRQRLVGLLGQFDISFKDYWFVTLSARNDWSSTLPIDKNSFFYGGVNTALILTDMLPTLKNNILSFWKVRAAVGQTGNDAPIYRLKTPFYRTKIVLGFGDLYMPLGGVPGLTYGNILGNNDLKPEITTEWEIGTDIRFFNNRIGIDVAYYNQVTKDQIIRASMAPETGFTSRTLNVGEIQNKGLELNLLLVPVKTRNFAWELNTNLTLNRSEVKKLYGDVKQLTINNAYLVDYVAEVGEPLGVFKVPQERRVEEGPYAGSLIVNNSGIPTIDPNAKKVVGTSEPDFIMGFNNRFTYKGFTLSAVIDWRKGGKFYSYTAQLMNFVGNSTMTAYNERQPFLVPNSVKVVSNQYVENDIPITYTGNYQYWYSNTNNTMYEKAILDKTYVKVRELSLSYSLPKSIYSKINLSGCEITVYGRNLLLFTPDSNNYLDPEGTNYGNDLTSEFGEFATGPTTRNYGISLKLNF